LNEEVAVVSRGSVSSTSSRLLLVVSVLAALILGFLGVMYILAAAYAPTRLVTGIVLIGLALVTFAFAYRTTLKPRPIVVSWSPSGPIKPEELKCPSCGAPLKVEDPRTTRVTCSYCGKTVEIVEEPKW